MKKVLLIILITTFIRLLFIGNFGLGDDEAHYWKYSSIPSLSYYDHPPMVGYLIKLSTDIFGNNEFAVRAPAVIIFALTSLLIYLIGLEIFSPAIAYKSFLLINIIPVFSFLGATLMVPDSPLAFFWVLYIYIFLQILKTPYKKYLWYLNGIILGLAFLSKYNAVFLPSGIFVFLLFLKKGRKILLEKEFYISLFIALIVFSPVIIWNMQNSFASFGYQLGHGFSSAKKFNIDTLGKCLGAQAGYISPFILIWILIIFIKSILDIVKYKNEKLFLIFCFSFPIIIFFNIVSGFKEILPHWPAMGYLMAIYFIAYYDEKYFGYRHINFKINKVDSLSIRNDNTRTVIARSPVSKHGISSVTRQSFIKLYSIGKNISITFALFLLLIVPFQLIFKLIPVGKFLPEKQRNETVYNISAGERADITNELFGYSIVAGEIDNIIRENKLSHPFILTHRHYIASQISFYEQNYETYCINDKTDQYDYWQRKKINLLKGTDGIFVTDNRFPFEPEKYYQFEKFLPYKTVDIFRKGKKIREFRLTICKNFLGDTKDVYVQEEKKFTDAVLYYDRFLFQVLNKLKRNKIEDFIFASFSRVGEGFILFPLGMILIFSLKYQEIKNTIKPEELSFKYLFKLTYKDMLFLGILLLLTGAIGQIIKSYFNRPRPLAYFGDLNIIKNSFIKPLYYRSFPSGHTIAAFSFAVFMSNRFKKYAIFFFLFAIFIGYSRIYNAVHFPLDVFTGAIIGVFGSLFILKIEKWIKKS